MNFKEKVSSDRDCHHIVLSFWGRKPGQSEGQRPQRLWRNKSRNLPKSFNLRSFPSLWSHWSGFISQSSVRGEKGLRGCLDVTRCLLCCSMPIDSELLVYFLDFSPKKMFVSPNKTVCFLSSEDKDYTLLHFLLWLSVRLDLNIRLNHYNAFHLLGKYTFFSSILVFPKCHWLS